MITMKTIRAPMIDRIATNLNTSIINNTKMSGPRRADLLHAPEPPKWHVAKLSSPLRWSSHTRTPSGAVNTILKSLQRLLGLPLELLGSKNY